MSSAQNKTSAVLKGRPPLEPRIKDLEGQVADLLTRMAVIESRLFMDNRTVPYESVFEKWPSQR